MEHVRKCIRLELFRNDDIKKTIQQQSKKTFNGIHKSYGNCDRYLLRKNEVLLDKPKYLGFAILKIE